MTTSGRSPGSVDTGLLDPQAWLDYLATGTETAPLAPDFARQQVFVDGWVPRSRRRDQHFTLGRPTGATVAPITARRST